MKTLEEMVNNSQPVLVDFYATWCGPCKMMHPILEELKSIVGEKAKIIKIDIDTHEELANEWRIKSVPTLMIFKDGEMKWRRSGVQNTLEILNELEKWM